MGKFVSVFIATLQYACGIYIFKKPDLKACGPLISSLVVLLALFFVLWSLPVYPRRLRKLVSGAHYMAEYLLSVFLIEYIMGSFWFPLETALMALLPKTATLLQDALFTIDFRCHFPCDLLRKEGTGMFVSYLHSFVILVAAMHATRAINLKLLRGGVKPFFQDVARRLNKFYKNISLYLGKYNRIQRRSQKRDYCRDQDDEDNFEFEPGYEGTDDTDCNY